MTNFGKRFSRRTVALFWTAIVGIIIATLIAYEQISVLYVLATLALVTLLLVVGFADLEKVSFDSSGKSIEDGK
jgi:hypothetical protein